MGGLCGKPEGKKVRESFLKGDPLYVCVIGDGGVGKTALLQRHMHDDFDPNYMPTIFDDYQGPTECDNYKGFVCLRDTAGQEAYDAINAASFKGVHCFLLCFAMKKGREASLSNAAAKWHKQLMDGGHLSDGAKIILVGTQMDQEASPGVEAEAARVAQEIGAVMFIPTSAYMQKHPDGNGPGGNVPKLFDEAVRAAMYVDG